MRSFFKAVMRGLGKRLAARLVRKEGDLLQAKVIEILRTKGPDEIDRVFDATQAAIEKGVLKAPFLSEQVKSSINAVVEQEGNKLQESVKKAWERGGLDGVAKAFDKAQEVLLARIQRI